MKYLVMLLTVFSVGCSSLVTSSDLRDCKQSCEEKGMNAVIEDGVCGCKEKEKTPEMKAIEALQLEVQSLKAKVDAQDAEKEKAKQEALEMHQQVEGMFKKEESSLEVKKEEVKEEIKVEPSKVDKIETEDLTLDQVLEKMSTEEKK